MKLVRLLGVIGVGSLLLVSGAAAQTSQESQPSLGDVVKQKPTKKAAKVITDDDIPKAAPEAAPEDASAAAKPKDQGTAQPSAAQPPAAEAQPGQIKAPDGTLLDTPERRVELAKASEAASKAKVEALQKQRDAATTDEEVANIDAQLQRERNYLAMYTAAREKAEADVEKEKKSQQQPSSQPPAPPPGAAPAPQ